MRIVLLAFCFLCVSACSKSNNREFQALHIVSNNVDIKLLRTFEEKFPKIKLIINEDTFGLEKSLASLDAGKIDAYITSVELPTDNNDLGSFLIAKDGIAIIANQANPISGLSTIQLAEIFSHQVNNWKAFSNYNQPILVIEREDQDLAKHALYTALFETTAWDTSNAVKVQDDRDAHEQIKKFPNSIAYVNFSEIKEVVKALDIEHIAVDKKNIEQGYYPILRDVRIYFKTNQLKKKSNYESFKTFMGHVLSIKGQELISSLGYMRLSNSDLASIQLEEEPIHIGVSVPLEGSYADLGRAIVNAARLAVEEVNDSGGLGNKLIELLVCNDEAKVKKALECANDFVKEGVVAVIGHLTSQESIEASKVYADHGIVQITPASTHPWFTERPGSRGFAFRTIGRDDKQAKLIVAEIDKLPYQRPIKISIFHNNTVYGNNLASLIRTEVVKLDKDKVIETVAIKKDQKQYHREVESLKSQVLVFVGEYGDAAQLMKELALSNKKDILFFGADGIFSQRFIDSAGLRAEGAFVTGSTINTESELAQSFIQNYRERFKVEASAFAMNSYDATKIILTAIMKSQNSGISIAEAVKSIKYNGVTGKIYFNQIGDPVLPRMTMYQVQEGKFVRI
jgi:branched-chain amino acid transport system substrate-binding protein